MISERILLHLKWYSDLARQSWTSSRRNLLGFLASLALLVDIC